MTTPYALTIPIPRHLWMTTTGTETIDDRARTRARLRKRGRDAWRQARRLGARPVDRYLLTVTVRGRGNESPILAAETLKPLIDAGTDTGLWPDDDPWHRAMTCYLQDPRPATGPSVALTVIPLGGEESPVERLMGCTPGAQGVSRGMLIPDTEWLTSNMRETPGTRRMKQTRVMRRAAPLWEGIRMRDCAVVTGIRYPDSRRKYKGDPDNTAETATAMWGAGVATGALPARPSLFAFMLMPGQSPPHTHGMSMLVFDTPTGFNWLAALV